MPVLNFIILLDPVFTIYLGLINNVLQTHFYS